MKKTVSSNVDTRGRVRSTTTYVLTSADSGSTITTGGVTITGLRYMDAPTVRGPAIFRLIDDATTRAVYNVDLNAAPTFFPQNRSAIWQALLLDANVPVGGNLIAVIPQGATLELDCT
jgi:hypothetical protein